MEDDAEVIAETRNGGDAEKGMELIDGDFSERIIGCCICVHKELGPGFLEKIYEEALAIELAKAGLSFERQKRVVVFYDEKPVGDHRLDFVIAGRVVLELKACKDIEDVHLVTVRSDLKAARLSLGLVVNFAKPTVEIRRVVLSR